MISPIEISERQNVCHGKGFSCQKNKWEDVIAWKISESFGTKVIGICFGKLFTRYTVSYYIRCRKF